MKRERFLVVCSILLAVLGVLSIPASAQLILGQYQDEAPVRTWNSFPYATAAALGRGETAFTLAADASAALANPALLPGLPKFTLLVNGSDRIAEFFKYGPVNTGVLTSDANVGMGLVGLDFAGLSLRLGDWSFALNISEAERYNRPAASYEETYPNSSYRYVMQFTQTGSLRTIHVSIARRIGARLSVGIGLNYAFGRLSRELFEQETPVGYTLSDKKTQDFSGLYVQGGLLFEISDKAKAAVVVRAPFAKKARNDSTVRFTYSPSADTDIGLTASSKDAADQPLIVGGGLGYRLFSELTLAIDASYFAWSKYVFDYFGEQQIRDFRDIIRIGVGAEYGSTVRIFGAKAQVPVRIGFLYDPQPMKDPRSAYACLTFGNGVHWARLDLDAGVLLGREYGSGNGLAVKQFAISVGFHL